MAATVLAVHDDIGFLLALAGELHKRRIALIPAATVPQAERLLVELGLKLDVLIIDCNIRTVCSFAAAMHKRSPALRVVGITSDRRRCAKCRDLLTTTVSRSEAQVVQWWVALIETLVHKLKRTS